VVTSSGRLDPQPMRQTSAIAGSMTVRFRIEN